MARKLASLARIANGWLVSTETMGVCGNYCSGRIAGYDAANVRSPPMMDVQLGHEAADSSTSWRLPAWSDSRQNFTDSAAELNWNKCPRWPANSCVCHTCVKLARTPFATITTSPAWNSPTSGLLET